MRTFILTVTALVAFAANSLLCRAALESGQIDPASFTSIRMLSGALVLWLIVVARKQTKLGGKNSLIPAMFLFAYMIFFSFAYVSLGAGTGALILFGAVQLTMFAVSLKGGEQFSLLSWAGLLTAFSGLVYLLLPGVTAPDPAGALMMAIAGIAWGGYSLLGRGAEDPLASSATNFLYGIPLVLVVSIAFLPALSVDTRGIWLAIMSGAVTSGLGYVVWYAALSGLGGSRAATVQLSVPAIAMFGGVLFLGEELTVRLLAATALTLGGIALVIWQTARRPQSG